jgi:hypothetical protein
VKFVVPPVLETVPVPPLLFAKLTVTVGVDTRGAIAAVTATSVVRGVIAHRLVVPVQVPAGGVPTNDHPVNALPTGTVAVRVTDEL